MRLDFNAVYIYSYVLSLPEMSTVVALLNLGLHVFKMKGLPTINHQSLVYDFTLLIKLLVIIKYELNTLTFENVSW